LRRSSPDWLEADGDGHGFNMATTLPNPKTISVPGSITRLLDCDSIYSRSLTGTTEGQRVELDEGLQFFTILARVGHDCGVSAAGIAVIESLTSTNSPGIAIVTQSSPGRRQAEFEQRTSESRRANRRRS
jgi:hypothetical protein